MRRLLFALLCVLVASAAWAQQVDTGKVAAEDPADEKGQFAKNCLFKHALGCAEVLFTGQPLHIAVGSIAPQNGVAGGIAFVGHKNTENNWRISWNSDAVVSGNSSWRAGVYVKFVDARIDQATPQLGTANARSSDTPTYTEQPVITLYTQAISLNKLAMFGLGPDTLSSGRAYYGMTETIVGSRAVLPVYGRLNMGVYGEVNGRFVDIRSSRSGDSPSIEELYTAVTAPGLATQPFFLQMAAGVRMRPSVAHERLHFNYDVAYRPFLAASNSDSSFHRISVDLGHTVSLYRTQVRVPRESNGPNDCVVDPTADRPRCPEPTKLSSMEGTISFRVLSTFSLTSDGNTVPFYLQPTLGGADVNGDAVLSSYEDYRFRAPNLLVLRESFEHSFGKLPVGFALMADQAKLALEPGDLGRSPWLHSYAAGITLRAGGFPVMYLLFAFGGSEGTHTIANISPSLLGTSGRPSLF